MKHYFLSLVVVQYVQLHQSNLSQFYSLFAQNSE